MPITEHNDFDLMSRRRLTDSLEATRTMLIVAQKTTKETQDAMISLGWDFCGEELMRRQEKNEDFYRIPPDELARLIRVNMKASMRVSRHGTGATASQFAEAKREIRDLRAEVESQRRRASDAEAQVKMRMKQIRSLEMTLENERKARREAEDRLPAATTGQDQSDPKNTEYAAWFGVWKKENRSCERDTRVIVAIGKTGYSRSKDLEQIMVNETGASHRTARRAIANCTDAGLLERWPTVSVGGRPAYVLTLTQKGTWLYQEHTGQEPKVGEHNQLLKAHKSERHLALILKVADLFYGLGFEVDREPMRIKIDDNRYFLPDLVVRKDDETYYLEVEHGTRVKPTLSRKWENAMIAGGRICVVTDNLIALRQIQGSIAQWSTYGGRKVILYATYIGALKEKKPGENPWYKVREYSPN